MGTVADSAAQDKCDPRAYGFTAINHEAIHQRRRSGDAVIGIEEFGIVRDSPQDGFMACRDESGRRAGVDCFLPTLDDDLLPHEHGPRHPFPCIDEDELEHLTSVVQVITIDDEAPVCQSYRELPELWTLRETIRDGWNTSDDVRDQIANLEQTITAFCDTYYEFILHPAHAMWIARVIAWLLFGKEDHPIPEEDPERARLLATLDDEDQLRDAGVPADLVVRREQLWTAFCSAPTDAKLDACDAARRECELAYAAHVQRRDAAIPKELVDRRLTCWRKKKEEYTNVVLREQYLEALRACEEAYEEMNRPTIQLSGQQTRIIVETTINVLLKLPLFCRLDRLARIVHDRDGVVYIDPLADEFLRGQVHHEADVVRRVRKVNYPATLPLGIIKEVRSFGRERFPTISGITASPFRADGTLASRGYDRTTQYYHVVPDLPPIPEAPTITEVRLAVRLLIQVFDEFPFEDDPSRANTLSALITIVARPMIEGGVPVFTVNAPKSGNGKTYLVEVLVMLALGIRISATPLTAHEEERRKLLLSLLLKSIAVVLLDNVVGALNSPVVASAITAGYIADRILGRSEIVRVPNTSVFFVTGNNLTITGELSRRRIPINLDAKVARPELRTFKQAELLRWVEEHRVELLHAVCVLIRAWVAAGRPKGSHPRPNSFGRWAELVGGVSSYCGITGFLDNLSQASQDDDIETSEWEAFLAFLHNQFKDQPFTASAVHDLASDGFKLNKDVVELLPGDLADWLGKATRTFPKRLGTAFRDHLRTRYGAYRLERAGLTANKVSLWKVMKEQQ